MELEARAMRRALSGFPCRFLTVGIRARHLPAVAELQGISLAILCGVAGGLDPSLAVGDVIVDDPAAVVNRPFHGRRGLIHSAHHPVVTPLQKRELFQQTGALAVDMEQETVRNFVRQSGVPFVGIRAISDTADHAIDPAVMQLVDDLGRPRPLQIAMTLIRRPGLVPQLRTLSTNTHIALEKLGLALQSIFPH